MDQKQLKVLAQAVSKNKIARELAQEILALAEAELTLQETEAPDSVNVQRFWETIAEGAAIKIDKVVVEEDQVDAMGDKEAKAFEESLVPFGIHTGEKMCDIDWAYWDAVINSEFNKQLRRYRNSARFRELREQGMI